MEIKKIKKKFSFNSARKIRKKKKEKKLEIELEIECKIRHRPRPTNFSFFLPTNHDQPRPTNPKIFEIFSFFLEKNVKFYFFLEINF